MRKNSEINQLKKFIREHQVRWEVHPAMEMVDGVRVRVGYEVEVGATNGSFHDELNQILLNGCSYFLG